MGTRVLYLVRHGQYFTDEEHPRFGRLTALGRRQAARTAKRLAAVPIDAIYHSDILRAVETMDIMSAALRKVPIHATRALRELMPPIPKRRGNPRRTRAELAEIREATVAIKRRFLKAPRGKRTRVYLLIAHGNLIRYFVRIALGEPGVDWVHWSTNNCGITVLTIRDRGNNYMTSYNDIGHLPESLQSMT